MAGVRYGSEVRDAMMSYEDQRNRRLRVES